MENKFREIAKHAYELKRNIKAYNRKTGESKIFCSKSQCAKYYNCSPALIFQKVSNDVNIQNNNNVIIFSYTEDEPNEIIPNAKIGRSKYETKEEKVKARNKHATKYIQHKAEEKKTYKQWLKNYKNYFIEKKKRTGFYEEDTEMYNKWLFSFRKIFN